MTKIIYVRRDISFVCLFMMALSIWGTKANVVIVAAVKPNIVVKSISYFSANMNE